MELPSIDGKTWPGLDRREAPAVKRQSETRMAPPGHRLHYDPDRETRDRWKRIDCRWPIRLPRPRIKQPALYPEPGPARVSGRLPELDWRQVPAGWVAELRDPLRALLRV